MNWFYNVLSILIGLGLIYFGITNIRKKKVLFGVLTFIHSILFVFFGIFGFFLPVEYESISVLAMLAFSITMIICILLLSKKEQKVKPQNKDNNIKDSKE